MRRRVRFFLRWLGRSRGDRTVRLFTGCLSHDLGEDVFGLCLDQFLSVVNTIFWLADSVIKAVCLQLYFLLVSPLVLLTRFEEILIFFRLHRLFSLFCSKHWYSYFYVSAMTH